MNLHTDTLLKKKKHICLFDYWLNFHSFLCSLSKEIGWTPDVLCAMECLDIQAETRPLEGSSSLRLLTRPCMIWPLCFSSSPTSSFVISLQPTSSHHSHPILESPKHVHIPQLHQTVSVLSSMFLTGLSWLFFIIHSSQVPIYTFRSPSLNCPKTCGRSFLVFQS